MAAVGTPEVRPRRDVAGRLWGDGFAGDGLAALRAAKSWDACSPDEYAMLFPNLVPSAGAFPLALRAHLETCVAIRAWRLARLDPALPAPTLHATVPAGAGDMHRAWFADDGAVACLLRQIGLLRTSPERLAFERRVLLLLDEILHLIQRGRTPIWTDDREAWFAFGSGIHPAYLWPESAIAPDRGCTAAWLGHLDRGRTALMPEIVAGYLLDAVLDGSRPGDRILADMVGHPDDAVRLQRGAARRLAGGDPVVSFGHGRRRRFTSAGDARFAASVREEALEHA